MDVDQSEYEHAMAGLNETMTKDWEFEKCSLEDQLSSVCIFRI